MANKCSICIHGGPVKGYIFEVTVSAPKRPDRTYVYFHQDGLMETKISDLRRYRPFKAWALLRQKAKFVTKISALEVAAARHEQLEFNFAKQS